MAVRRDTVVAASLVAIAALALGAAIAVIAARVLAGTWRPFPHDAISLEEARIAPLGAHLAAERVAGYVADDRGTGMAATEDFVIAQYALAPVILRRHDVRQRLVVGDFAGRAPRIDPRLVPLLDLGGGVMLFEGRPRAE
jgi:hypothetical protein